MSLYLGGVVPVHLRPSAPTAADAILCGDPARALMIAQEVMVEPRMSNHHRGLWGYHGRTAEGGELTVQATGIGGPSAAVVLGELAELGVRRAIRIGTCTAPAGGPPIAGRLAVAEVIAADGTSAALGVESGATLKPSPALTERLQATTGNGRWRVVSRDLHASAGGEGAAGTVSDLQSAAVLAAAARLGIEAGIGLVVAAGSEGRLEDDPLDAALLELARAAAGALGPR